MAKYCKIMVRDSNNQIQVLPEIYQNYDAFAVLAGVRNYCSIEPIFGWRDIPDFLKGLDTDDLVGWGWHSGTHFTLKEFDQFDFEQPLRFLGEKEKLHESLKHRLKSLQEGDTYRRFMKRETDVFKWIESIRQLNLPDVTVVLFFD